jgi:hypothetical protein
MGLKAGLDDVEKRKFLTIPGLELRPVGRPARSQSLSRLLCVSPLLTSMVEPVFMELGIHNIAPV